jgi:hypothetical protein
MPLRSESWYGQHWRSLRRGRETHEAARFHRIDPGRSNCLADAVARQQSAKYPGWLPACGIAFNQHYDADGAIIYKHACALGCEGIVSKRLGSSYRSGRADCWVKVKNPAAPAVRREAEEDWS